MSLCVSFIFFISPLSSLLYFHPVAPTPPTSTNTFYTSLLFNNDSKFCIISGSGSSCSVRAVPAGRDVSVFTAAAFHLHRSHTPGAQHTGTCLTQIMHYSCVEQKSISRLLSDLHLCCLASDSVL